VTTLCLVSELHRPPSEEQLARQELSTLDAVLLAADRRHEVLDAIAEARDPDEACRSVAEILGITEHSGAARAVVELRLRRFSRSEVARLHSERDALKGRLGEGL
jgi:DNA gyrase/topoisomerase IV subunit A